MRPSKMGFSVSLLLLLIAAAPRPGWSTRVAGMIITGQVTSMPASGQIEVDHLVYRVRAGTPAERNLRKFHMGQVVDLELDAPVATKTAQVVFIAAHVGPGGDND